MKSNKYIILALGLISIILLISVLIIYKQNTVENFDTTSANNITATLTSTVPLSDTEFANKLTNSMSSLNCKSGTTDLNTVLGNIFTQKKKDINDFKNFYNKYIIGYSGIPEFENYMLNNVDFLKDYALNNKEDYIKKYFVKYINIINPTTSKILTCADVKEALGTGTSTTSAPISFINLFISYVKSVNSPINSIDGFIYYS